MNARMPLNAAALALAAALCLICCSCMSVGYRVELKPEEGREAASKIKAPPRYYIAALAFKSEDHRTLKAADFSGHIDAFAGDQQRDKNTPKDIENLRRIIANECRARFPELFAAEGEMAIPVLVCIDSSIGEENVKLGAFLSGFLTLGTIPGPFSMQYVYKINALPYDGTAPGPTPPPDTRSCIYEQAGWVSVFSPFGLIPYWGKTDVPPVSFTLSNMDGAMDDCRKRTFALFADAIAIELLKRQPLLAGIPECKAGPASQPQLIQAALPGGPQAPSQTSGGAVVAPSSHPSSGGINSL